MKKIMVSIALVAVVGLTSWVSFKAGEHKSAKFYRAMEASHAAGMLTAVDRADMNQQLFKDIVYRIHVSKVRGAISNYGKNSDNWYSIFTVLVPQAEEELLRSSAKTYLKFKDKLQSEFENAGAGKAQLEQEENFNFQKGMEKLIGNAITNN